MDDFAEQFSVQSKKAKKKKSTKTPKKKKTSKVNGGGDLPGAPFDANGFKKSPQISVKKKKVKANKSSSEPVPPDDLEPNQPAAGRAIKRPPTMTKYDGTPYKNPFKAWMHPPKKHAETGSQIIFKVPKKTNFVRGVKTAMDNAPFFWHKVVGDFECLVHVSGDMEHAGQKAGLMIRVDPENWVTSALEHHPDGMLVHSTTITKDNSDTSFVVCPTKHGAGSAIGTEFLAQNKGVFSAAEEGIWLCAKRLGNVYESYFSTNGQSWILTRQGLLHIEAEWIRLGIFGASNSAHAFEITFDMYECHVHRDYDDSP